MIWVGGKNSELRFPSNDLQQYVVHFEIGSELDENFLIFLVEYYSHQVLI